MQRTQGLQRREQVLLIMIHLCGLGVLCARLHLIIPCHIVIYNRELKLAIDRIHKKWRTAKVMARPLAATNCLLNYETRESTRKQWLVFM